MKESQVQHETVKRLKSAGWFVLVTSQDKATRKHVAGLPDLLAFRNNHTLLIECKGDGGKPRQSQVEFRVNIRPHEGENLHYVIVWHPDDLDRYGYYRD
jgi:Holliday junction resolvase